MRNTKVLKCRLSFVILTSFLFLTLPNLSLAQTNPCAPKAKKASQNPCAAKNPCAVNPCAVKNPCATKNPCAANPCAPTGKGAGPVSKATTVRGEVIRVDPKAGKLLLKTAGKQIDLNLSKHAVVREGPKVKKINQVKPGDKAMVSYVESGKNRTAWYVYLASAASVGNPCAANPCAAKNPCAANPCAPKNPCAPTNPCGVR